jgi:glutamate synthase domain-containing protein 2
MSYGSISQEAHEALAIVHESQSVGKSNYGEGGEILKLQWTNELGDSKNSAI